MPLNRSIVLSVLSIFFFALTAVGSPQNSDCQSCHRSIETNCNLKCVACHTSPKARFIPDVSGHPAIIRNPSAEQWWEEKCTRCHADAISRFKNSLHYSASGIINQTRFLWGKQKNLTASGAESWKELRTVHAPSGKTPADLVDHLLAGKCLRCHFAAEARQAPAGMKRPAGCAACHVALDQKTGKPLHGHRFQKQVSDTTCLTCHNGNHVGGDYYGYFEHDYGAEYHSPFGRQPYFGAFQHRLQPDIHQKAGLQCMDCHSTRDVMGSAQVRHYEGERPVVRCVTCHGGFNGESVTNKNHAGKRFDPKIVAHGKFHARITCTTCHAQWAYQDYGLHLFLDHTRHYEMWENFLWQGDGHLQRWLSRQLALPENKRQNARSINYLSGKEMPGIWYKGWTFRRWETPVLGWNTRGQIAVMRPLFQYFITFVDSLDRVWLDSARPQTAKGRVGWNWDAFVPHTIGAKARDCQSCHLNPKAVGLGIRPTAKDSVAHPITVPSSPILPGSRLLNEKERRKLLQKTPLYRKWRRRQLEQNGVLQLFLETQSTK